MLTHGVYDFRVDVWALGILMYECLVGSPPFEVPDSVEETHKAIQEGPITYPPELSMGISSSAKDLIKKLLAKKPEDRPSLEEVLAHPFLAPHVSEA